MFLFCETNSKSKEDREPTEQVGASSLSTGVFVRTRLVEEIAVVRLNVTFAKNLRKGTLRPLLNCIAYRRLDAITISS